MNNADTTAAPPIGRAYGPRPKRGLPFVKPLGIKRGNRSTATPAIPPPTVLRGNGYGRRRI